jgi:hypothetical protein
VTTKYKTVDEYLKELSKSKADKPHQVRQGIEIYVELWEAVLRKGLVGPGDDIETALAKLESLGGLYTAAES